MKMIVFWVVAPCSLVEVYQRSRGVCCLHHQGDRGVITQKTVIFLTNTQLISKSAIGPSSSIVSVVDNYKIFL
jgi:hypothetical protein